MNCDQELERLLERSSKAAFRAACAVLKNHADAEDITQDTMVKAYESFAQLRYRDSFRPWIARIAWRLALNKLRAERSRSGCQFPVEFIKRQANPIDCIIMSDQCSRLYEAITSLPQQFRLVTVLVGIEEYSIKAIAESLNVSEGTVKSRLFRARQMLKELMQ